MPYVKTPINPGDILDPNWGNKVQEQYDEAIEDITTQESWIAPTFENGWTHYDGGSYYDSVGYMKDELGFVHLKGTAKSGTEGTVIFTLPTGYRPAKAKKLPTVTYNSPTGKDGFGAIQINANGQVVAMISNGNYLSLDLPPFEAVR